MERRCINCKWYWSERCNCKATLGVIKEEEDYRHIQFIEDGHWSKLVQEQIDIKKVLGGLIKDLTEQDFIKKNKSLKNMDLLQSEEDLVEYITGALEVGIQNYFEPDKYKSNELIIHNPRDFGCINWE